MADNLMTAGVAPKEREKKAQWLAVASPFLPTWRHLLAAGGTTFPTAPMSPSGLGWPSIGRRSNQSMYSPLFDPHPLDCLMGTCWYMTEWIVSTRMDELNFFPFIVDWRLPVDPGVQHVAERVQFELSLPQNGHHRKSYPPHHRRHAGQRNWLLFPCVRPTPFDCRPIAAEWRARRAAASWPDPMSSQSTPEMALEQRFTHEFPPWIDPSAIGAVGAEPHGPHCHLIQDRRLLTGRAVANSLPPGSWRDSFGPVSFVFPPIWSWAEWATCLFVRSDWTPTRKWEGLMRPASAPLPLRCPSAAPPNPCGIIIMLSSGLGFVVSRVGISGWKLPIDGRDPRCLFLSPSHWRVPPAILGGPAGIFECEWTIIAPIGCLIAFISPGSAAPMRRTAPSRGFSRPDPYRIRRPCYRDLARDLSTGWAKTLRLWWIPPPLPTRPGRILAGSWQDLSTTPLSRCADGNWLPIDDCFRYLEPWRHASCASANPSTAPASRSCSRWIPRWRSTPGRAKTRILFKETTKAWLLAPESESINPAGRWHRGGNPQSILIRSSWPRGGETRLPAGGNIPVAGHTDGDGHTLRLLTDPWGFRVRRMSSIDCHRAPSTSQNPRSGHGHHHRVQCCFMERRCQLILWQRSCQDPYRHRNWQRRRSRARPMQQHSITMNQPWF